MNKTILIAAISIFASSIAFAASHEVGQKNKAFDKESITINVGDSVKFTNNDPFFHNVFSLSEISTFDLGSYPKGEFKEVVFDKAGRIEVECAIHPNMYMIINVE